MLNSSIYSVFERMWEHVLLKCNNYVSTEAFNSHAENTGNPHVVNAEQIGLGKVDNTSDMEKPISEAVDAALGNKANSEDLNNHIENTGNPHGVNAEQVGALSIAGGAMDGKLTLNGIILTKGTDYGSSDPGSGVLGQLYFKKVT